MRATCRFIALGVALALPVAAAAADEPVPIKLDSELQLPGVDLACTGVGQSKSDPKWQAYPVRVEFANPAREYLSDEALSVSDSAGHVLASVRCEGPWILVRPTNPGAYTVQGWLTHGDAKPRGGSFRVPTKGQLRLVLTFPDA